MFVSESDAGVEHQIVLGARRQAYLVCIEGSLAVGAPDAGEHSGVRRGLPALPCCGRFCVAPPGCR